MNLMKRVKNNRGMSLMETLSAAMIFVVIFMLTYGIFDSGNRLMSVTDASANNQLEIRQALMDMERAIRGSTRVNEMQRNFGGLQELGKTELLFTLNGIDYHYYITKEDWADPNETLYQLRELIEGGEDRVIAHDVVSCTFDLVIPPEDPAMSRNEKKKVLITITVRQTINDNKNIDFTLQQWVTLRNADGSPCSETSLLSGKPPAFQENDNS